MHFIFGTKTSIEYYKFWCMLQWHRGLLMTYFIHTRYHRYEWHSNCASVWWSKVIRVKSWTGRQTQWHEFAWPRTINFKSIVRSQSGILFLVKGPRRLISNWSLLSYWLMRYLSPQVRWLNTSLQRFHLKWLPSWCFTIGYLIPY